jgi:hypothetical protein
MQIAVTFQASNILLNHMGWGGGVGGGGWRSTPTSNFIIFDTVLQRCVHTAFSDGFLLF